MTKEEEEKKVSKDMINIYLHLPLMKKVQLTKLRSRTKVGHFREAMTGFSEVPLSIAAGLLRLSTRDAEDDEEPPEMIILRK